MSIVSIMISFLFLALLYTINATTTTITPTSSDALIHSSLHRIIDLSSVGSRVVRESYLIHVLNSGSTPILNYHFSIPLPRYNRLAWISALQPSSLDDSTIISLSASHSNFLTIEDEFNNDSYYTINFQLKSPILPSHSSNIKLSLSFIDDMTPFPSAISQTESQRMLFLDSFDISYLPYITQQIKISVKLPTQTDPISYSNTVKPVKVQQGTITYGPINPKKWIGMDLTLRIHFYSYKVGLIADTWRRDVWVRMFGASVEVEEHVKVTYDGARLNGHFSRLDYMKSFMSMDTHKILPQFPIRLPKTAQQVYYKDEIGNVSTSRVSIVRNQRLLEIQPRYPLLGGWTYNWHHGYVMDGKEAIKYDTNSGRTTVTVPIVLGIPSVAIRSLDFKLVLPEGSQNILINDARTGMPITDYDLDMTYYYFDSTGRPSITLHRNNVLVEDNWELISISYTLHPLRRIQKPLAVISFIIVIYALITLVKSIDLSITKKDQHIINRILRISTDIDHTLDKLCNAIDTYSTAKDMDSLRNAKSLAIQVLTSSFHSLHKQSDNIKALVKKNDSNNRTTIQTTSLIIKLINSLQERYDTISEAIDILLSTKSTTATNTTSSIWDDVNLLMNRDNKVKDELQSIVKSIKK